MWTQSEFPFQGWGAPPRGSESCQGEVFHFCLKIVNITCIENVFHFQDIRLIPLKLIACMFLSYEIVSWIMCDIKHPIPLGMQQFI